MNGKMKGTMTRLLGVGLLALAASAPRPAAAQEVDHTGMGWAFSNLDLSVRVEPRRSRIEVTADLVVHLADFPRSDRLALVMNARDTIMSFDSVTTDRGVVTALNGEVPGRPATKAAYIDFTDGAARQGDEVRVRVYASSLTTIPQFSLAQDVALASWVTGWYPLPLPTPTKGLSAAVKAPGSARFDLPAGWRVVSNGKRVEMEERGGRTYERWVNDQPLARSFSAGPYRVVGGDAEGRAVELFLLTVGEAEAREQATTLARAIGALEKRFGAYPTGGYAIAEVPEWVPGFLASSEQGFMMAKPVNFEVAGGNIPLFAHEAAHGYWGNLLTSSGPGSAFLSESISQYGAYIALEEMLGEEAAVEFLKVGRDGYIRYQSARGYFEVVERGADSVGIADMEHIQTRARRTVVDSKGTWIYHMLRQLVGDEVFFGTLRAYLRDRAGNATSLDEFRETFIQVAPETDLERFFEQWLDRTGAPRFDVEWTAMGNEVEVTVRQTQEGEPYAVSLELLVRGTDGTGEIHEVMVDSTQEVVRLPAPSGVTEVVLDPHFRILRWDESYRR
jgi:hypothetical protein